MKVKKLIIVSAIILGLGFLAIHDLNAEAFSGNASISHNSELKFRGASNYESAAEVDINADTSIFGVDLGLGLDLNIRDESQDEIRFSTEIGLNLLESVETSFGIVTYKDNHVIGSTSELFFSVGADVILDPTVTVFYNPNRSDTTVEGSISKKVEIIEDVSVEVGVEVGTVVANNDNGFYYGLDVIATYDLNEDVDLFVGVNFSEIEGVSFRSPDTSFIIGATYTY